MASANANHLAVVLASTIIARDRSRMLSLLSRDLNVNADVLVGKTPLHFAAVMNDAESVSLLLEAGASISAFDDRGRTTLHEATRKGHVDMVDLLLAKGADVNSVLPRAPEGAKDYRRPTGQTPMHVAAKACNVTLLQRFVALGADVNVAAIDGRTPLHFAAQFDVTGETVAWLCAHGANVDALDKIKRNALFYAVNQDNYEVVRLLLEHKALPNRGTNKFSAMRYVYPSSMDLAASLHSPRAVCQAALRGNYEITKQLLDAGANINMRQMSGHTALSGACHQGHARIVAMLLARGANPHVLGPEPTCWSTLHYSALGQDARVTDMLIDAGVALDVRSAYNGRTALHLAATVRAAEVVHTLLLHGADSSILDNEGMTPMYVAVAHGGGMAVDLFKSFGEDINAVDASGCPALHRLMTYGAPRLMAVLDQGADPYLRDSEGLNLLQRAADEDKEDIVVALLASGIAFTNTTVDAIDRA